MKLTDTICVSPSVWLKSSGQKSCVPQTHIQNLLKTVVINFENLLDKTLSLLCPYALILHESPDTLLNSGSQRCCQWVSYSKIFIFQSNIIYICSLPLALICLLITRLLFVFQMLKRLCWVVQEICLDCAHKAYLLTFDIFTGWETKWKIQVFKLHRWYLSQSIYFQNKEYPCSRQSLEQLNSDFQDRDPHTLRALGPAEPSWNPSIHPSIHQDIYCLRSAKHPSAKLWCLYSQQM